MGSSSYGDPYAYNTPYYAAQNPPQMSRAISEPPHPFAGGAMPAGNEFMQHSHSAQTVQTRSHHQQHHSRPHRVSNAQQPAHHSKWQLHQEEVRHSIMVIDTELTHQPPGVKPHGRLFGYCDEKLNSWQNIDSSKSHGCTFFSRAAQAHSGLAILEVHGTQESALRKWVPFMPENRTYENDCMTDWHQLSWDATRAEWVHQRCPQRPQLPHPCVSVCTSVRQIIY